MLALTSDLGSGGCLLFGSVFRSHAWGMGRERRASLHVPQSALRQVGTKRTGSGTTHGFGTGVRFRILQGAWCRKLEAGHTEKSHLFMCPALGISIFWPPPQLSGNASFGRSSLQIKCPAVVAKDFSTMH